MPIYRQAPSHPQGARTRQTAARSARPPPKEVAQIGSAIGREFSHHALVQDAAYGTLLREPRRALHARISETLESRFAETAESQPEILAHHCTEAGLIEKAADLWGKAGQQSQARSALDQHR